MIKFVVEKIREIYSLVKAIDWPSANTVVRYSVAVILISAIITGYLVGLDSIFGIIRYLTL